MQSPIEIGKQIAALGRLKLLYEVVLATPITLCAPDENGVFTKINGFKAPSESLETICRLLAGAEAT